MMTKIPVRSWRLASAVGLVAIVSALAAAPAFASCFAPGQQPKATVVELQASLASLLGGDADKNAGAIIATVRDLAAADPGSLSFILTKLGDASDAQRSSIGTGLGQAATICQRTDLAFATDIQTQLLAVDESIDNKAAETAFALATGQSPIGATAAGGGGGGFSSGASGGQLGSYSTPTASGTSAFQSLGTYSTKTTINLFTIGGNGSTSYTYSPIVKSVSSP
jgi:hypothetical protein